jgi:hypothetical protein
VEEKGAQLQSFLPCFSPFFFHSRKPNRWQKKEVKNVEHACECPISETLTKKQFRPTGEVKEDKDNLVWAHFTDMLLHTPHQSSEGTEIQAPSQKKKKNDGEEVTPSCVFRQGAHGSASFNYTSTNKGVDDAVALKAIKKNDPKMHDSLQKIFDCFDVAVSPEDKIRHIIYDEQLLQKCKKPANKPGKGHHHDSNKDGTVVIKTGFSTLECVPFFLPSSLPSIHPSSFRPSILSSFLRSSSLHSSLLPSFFPPFYPSFAIPSLLHFAHPSSSFLPPFLKGTDLTQSC